MSAQSNGHDTRAAVREAMRQAGLSWHTTPVVIQDTPPVEPPSPFQIVREPEKQPSPRREVPDLAAEHAKLHNELGASTLNSMTLVFIGLIVGYGLAMAVVYFQGKV